jgi:hypothetical protein
VTALLERAKQLDREARHHLGKIPAVARAMYPGYVGDAIKFCDALSQLVRDMEAIESIAENKS